MQIHTQPKVYFVGMTQLVHGHDKSGLLTYDDWLAQFPDYRSDANHTNDELVETMGRICYLSYDKPRPQAITDKTRAFTYLKHIVSSGHTSLLEFIDFSFIIRGVDRAFTHELVRHRVGTAFSQLSTRYVDQYKTHKIPDSCKKEEEFLGVVMPEAVMADEELRDDWLSLHMYAKEKYTICYNTLLQKLRANGMEGREATKAAREDAMGLLPNSVETVIGFKCNIRELMHIFGLRLAPDANKKFRMVAQQMYKVVDAHSSIPAIKRALLENEKSS